MSSKIQSYEGLINDESFKEKKHFFKSFGVAFWIFFEEKPKNELLDEKFLTTLHKEKLVSIAECADDRDHESLRVVIISHMIVKGMISRADFRKYYNLFRDKDAKQKIAQFFLDTEKVKEPAHQAVLGM